MRKPMRVGFRSATVEDGPGAQVRAPRARKCAPRGRGARLRGRRERPRGVRGVAPSRY